MKTLWLAALVVFFGCASSVSGEEHYTIAMMPKGARLEFWRAMHAGAEKARIELGEKEVHVRLLWRNPLKDNNVDEQMQAVEDFIQQSVSGMVLAPLDARELAVPVESAALAKIPIVIVDSGLLSRAHVSFVATDNREGGRIAARNLGTSLQGKGNIILLRYVEGSNSTEEREVGFLDTLKKEFPGIRVLSSREHAGSSAESAQQAAEDLLDRYGSNLQGIVAVNESSATGTLNALRAAGLAGKVKFIGFDSSALLNEALLAGEIDGLVVQNPFNMGYLGLKTIVAALQGKSVELRIDTGVGFVTKANFESPEMADYVRPPIQKYLP